MATPPHAPDPARLRRLALDRQGLLRAAPFGRGRGAVLRAIEHLGYVQIDSIAVVERAHHHVLRSRVPNYRPAHLDALVSAGEVFEYWYHAAAYLPMSDYRFALPRMAAMRAGRERWLRSRDQRLMRYVLDRIRAEGPLLARDFAGPRPAGAAGWWNWKPTKQALEQLFMQGDLMAVRREGFQKRYELTERVLPAHVDTRMPSLAEQAKHLVDNALRAHGFADAKSITHLRRGTPLREAVKTELAEREAAGRVQRIRLPNGTAAWLDAELTAVRTPRAGTQARLLSPFDNAVILRHRGQAVFDFDYQIECYLPAEQRRYGYFSLPLLLGAHFIGRADCKADRARRVLRVHHLALEPAAAGADRERFADALAPALQAFADCNGCDRIAVHRVRPAALAAALVQRLETAPRGP